MTEAQITAFHLELLAEVATRGGQTPENALVVWGARDDKRSPDTVFGLIQGLIFEGRLKRTRGFDRWGATFWVGLPEGKL